MSARAPIAVALDTADLATATSWAVAAAPYVTTAKVGLELFAAHGAQAVEQVREQSGLAVFLDLKLHDIPATVAGATRAVAKLSPEYLTVHASGGPAMVAAAVEALPSTRIAAVTVLTSLAPETLDEIGLAGPPDDAVVRLARLAVANGARAIVCSPREVAAVRPAVGSDVTLIVPGVRPAGHGSDDQARIATPAQARAQGADLLVVGRPITGAPDPGEAAAAIARDLDRPVLA
jgi:orotidine-5'-phosphate decarboxylase